jgi:hypothetical protein
LIAYPDELQVLETVPSSLADALRETPKLAELL